MLSKKVFLRRGLVILCFGMAIFPLFYRLGDAPLRLWDESLFAMRAYYMAEKGAFLSNFDYFPGITFYRNLKPPFGTWFQALSFRWFGYSEWALRLPVAVFSSLLPALVFILGNRAIRNTAAGVVAGLILIASPGFLRDHVARTGDHDAILLLLMTGGLFSCFFLAQTADRPRQRLYIALLGLSLFLGFLTKSFFAFAFCPAFLLFLLLNGKLAVLLRDPFTWIVATAVAAGIGLYYLRMESAFPGFWQYESDTVLGRYVKVQDGHQLAWNYYLGEFFDKRFFPWFFLLPLHLYLTVKTSSQAFRNFGMLLWLSFLCHFLLITFSTTKLSWYDAPLYPVAALMAGSAVAALVSQWKTTPLKQGIAIAALLLVFATVYFQGIKTFSTAAPASSEEYYQPFIRKLKAERPDLKQYTVYCYEYNGQVGFTARLLNDKSGYDISVAVYYPETGFQKGTYIMVCNSEKEERVTSAHRVRVEAEYAPCRLLYIME
ncbi:MAG: glycosyltransferase family 39 protein [Saprospiraceae bacterium]|nr:glycosyltransferase family 39 protein [Saprospiraceae bacterium]